jgi:hypothetical protein
MKRKLLPPGWLKQTALAVPAAALMLGAAQAGTTVGLNFQSWYYDSGATPQTVGFGAGYQTTGFPVTAKAFGVNVGNWVNTEPLDCSSAVDATVTAGGVTAHLTTVNMWGSDIGNLVNPADEWSQGGTWPNPLPVSWSSVLPGNDEVTWSFEDNTGWTNTLSGLNAAFPNGYVIELIGVSKCSVNSRVYVYGATITTNAFDVIYVAGNANYPGPVGLMALSGYTGDSITFGSETRNISSPRSCALAGFILTDQPVVTKSQGNVTVNQGAALSLNARVVGVGTLSYQWQHAGTNYPGATTVPFIKTATPEDAGSWALVATNSFGTGTSDVATVTVNQVPLITTDLSGTTNTIYAGFYPVLTVAVGGAEPLSYQWKKDGVAIPGATTASLTVSNIPAGLSGYNLFVTNIYDQATSSTNYLNAVPAPDSYTAQVGQDAPIGYWPLGETSGALAIDYAGTDHNGAISNNVTQGVVGPRPPTFPAFASGKTAYEFDGATGFIDCGTGPALGGLTDFTVEAWVNTTSTTFSRLIQQRYQNGYNGEYMVDINANGTVSFTIYGNLSYQYSFSSTVSVNDGNWHYIAAQRSGVNGYIYIDGGLVGQASGEIKPLDPTFTVGFGRDFRDNVSFYSGKLANVAIYNKALSSSRIISHYVTAAGIPLALQLTAGGLIEDSKPLGTPHPGQNYGTTWLASSSDTGGGTATRTGIRQFSAAGATKITTAPSPDYDSPTGTFTFWIKAAAPIPGPGQEAAILMDRRTTNGTVIALNDAGAIFVQCSGGANSLSAGYLPDDNWHCVAVTYDQSATGSIEIFVDGTSALSQANTAAWSWPTTQEIELGASHDTYWKRFDGQMDDFRIYSRVLTATEIASINSTGDLVDTAALKLRYNFSTAAGVGQTVKWPYGTLLSSPNLGPSANWTPVPGAMPPSYSFMPDGTSLFFQAGY